MRLDNDLDICCPSELLQAIECAKEVISRLRLEKDAEQVRTQKAGLRDLDLEVSAVVGPAHAAEVSEIGCASQRNALARRPDSAKKLLDRNLVEKVLGNLDQRCLTQRPRNAHFFQRRVTQWPACDPERH